MTTLGWTEGRNIHFDYRYWVPGGPARMASAATELVRLGPDVIVADGANAVAVLQARTHAIPIVFDQVADPVGLGFVGSLAHPGGNVTGFTYFDYSIVGKWAELLREMAPGLSRVLMISDSVWQKYPRSGYLRTIRALGSSIGVPVSLTFYQTGAGLERTIVDFAQRPGGGLVLAPFGLNSAGKAAIVQLALRYRLPAIYANDGFMDEGGLMCYTGTTEDDVEAEVAAYVNRILRGASPGDLPVQNPTKYRLSINLKTAKALGLTVPPSLLVSANELIR